ncbi:MAG: ABC-F family ATP-binding cassette domain-containing protein, partial [Selenomonas sp.]|nr:ABC-F family ATP-binding cassette domain-containing protein [Selenomonas sp.]
MGILKVMNLAKSFGIDELFKDVNFEVRGSDKVGLVGANGAGKTTLMRIILGEEEADSGTVQLDAAESIGYVEQQADFGEGTLYDEFLRAFADIIELAQRKRQLEKAIAQSADEALLDTYGKVVERFEQLNGYEFESRIKRVAYGLGF